MSYFNFFRVPGSFNPSVLAAGNEPPPQQFLILRRSAGTDYSRHSRAPLCISSSGPAPALGKQLGEHVGGLQLGEPLPAQRRRLGGHPQAPVATQDPRPSHAMPHPVTRPVTPQHMPQSRPATSNHICLVTPDHMTQPRIPTPGSPQRQSSRSHPVRTPS